MDVQDAEIANDNVPQPKGPQNLKYGPYSEVDTAASSKIGDRRSLHEVVAVFEGWLFQNPTG
ncbi:hypothetical protein PAAG_03915 [Paracoccidioides lutzii Pb01]|uniref:Uncharacterized protein n=1 Tax=Paracoccidioides lutzii (strain ATCC MYA-826 / Pb01) TaxID=502779 RepID=C1GZH1_PARBA|nr:hypothetical protein PAAG_03915 [Paracoccidioides lutzii Pb01]EEH41994.2 hypothetical protein PAAG_03915 [Paracoccidioides lutzii Pb01]